MTKKKKKRRKVHNPITYNFTKKYIYYYYAFFLDTSVDIYIFLNEQKIYINNYCNFSHRTFRPWYLCITN